MLSEKRLKKEIEKINLWIQEYLKKAGARGVVIGNSGGKDSATVIALATKAIRKRKCINCWNAM